MDNWTFGWTLALIGGAGTDVGAMDLEPAHLLIKSFSPATRRNR
jgi:hypothetical protein